MQSGPRPASAVAVVAAVEEAVVLELERESGPVPPGLTHSINHDGAQVSGDTQRKKNAGKKNQTNRVPFLRIPDRKRLHLHCLAESGGINDAESRVSTLWSGGTTTERACAAFVSEDIAQIGPAHPARSGDSSEPIQTTPTNRS